MSNTTEITEFVESVARRMGLDLKASAEEMPDGLRVNLEGEDGSLLIRRQGEALAARAAGDAGTVYGLSTLSGTRLEEVKAASKGPCWRAASWSTSSRASTRSSSRRPR